MQLQDFRMLQILILGTFYVDPNSIQTNVLWANAIFVDYVVQGTTKERVSRQMSKDGGVINKRKRKKDEIDLQIPQVVRK